LSLSSSSTIVHPPTQLRLPAWRVQVAAVDFCLLLPLLVWLLVLNKTSVWSAGVSKILTDILFYVRDIPQSTRTISGTNHIKWCQ
jgi:hypothetical protein